MDEHLATVYDAILDGDVMGATDGVLAALAADLQPERTLNEGMISAPYDFPPDARATTSSRDKACPVV